MINNISEWKEEDFEENGEENEAPEIKLTKEGFMEVGRLLEDILEEVLAFTEMAKRFENDAENIENEEMALLGGQSHQICTLPVAT